MRKIRIMHIAQSAGGVDRYLQMFFKNIDRNSFENILVCSQDYDKSKYIGIVDSFECIEMFREISIFKDISAIYKIRKLIKEYQPDILYTHSSKAGALGRIANFAINNKVIYNAHGWAFNIPEIGIKKYIYVGIEKILCKLTDYIIAISNFEKKSAILNNICENNKIKVIYNGIDFNEYSKSKIISRSELGIPDDAYVIGCVGRLTRQKAPDTFIHVAKHVNNTIDNAYFVMVGEGEERSKIESLINKYELKNKVIITGWVDNPIDYIELFDQAMLLSRWEGFGLVLAEYMYAQKVVIATNVDAIPDVIVDKKTGFLVEIDNIEEISRLIMEIYQDRNLKQSLVDKAYERVCEMFTIERVIKEHERLFSDLVI